MNALRRLSVATLLSVCLVCLASMVSAQSTTGVIFGEVKDQSGAVLPGVEVTILNLATNQGRTAVTNETGSYNIPLVTIGQYKVTAVLSGFKTEVRSGITIQVDQRARIDFLLQVGQLEDQVVVTEQVPMVQSTSASLGSVVDNRRVQELPLNSRDFEKLALLIPGASPPQQASSLSFRGGITIGGANERGNNFTFDGISNTTHNFFTYVYKPSIDEIQEFKVQPNSYDAESGRGEGGQVTVTSKSGSNAFHASLFEFLRNDRMDARNFFDNQPGSVKPPYKRNQFGGNLGGPIVRDKTFFFVNYEGLRLRQSETRAATVPTDRMRVGDFSEIIGTTTIRDPLTGQPFEGNVIPANRLHPIGVKMMSLYPKAKIQGVIARNFVNSTPSPDDSSQTTIRIDHTFSSKDATFVRYSRYRDRFIDAYNQQSGISNLPGFARDDTQHNHAATISYVHVFSPTLINTFKAGFSRLLQDRKTQDLTDYVSFLGIPGPVIIDPGITGVPDIRPTGVEPIGNPSNLPQGRSDLHYQYVNTVSWNRGNHSMKFGADFARMQIFRRSWGNDRGTYRFDGRYSGYGVADMLLGLSNQAGRALGDSHSYLFETQMMFFIQDDWRVTPRLTLNLGLRYENLTPWYDKFDRMSNYNPETNSIELAGKPTPQREYLRAETLDPQLTSISAQFKFVDLGERYMFVHDNNNFMPRVGFAWDALGTNRLVLRGGAGVFFTTITTAQDLGNNYPFRINQTFNNTSVPASRIMPANTYTLSNPFGGQGTSTITMIARDKNFQNGYAMKFSLGGQWEFMRDFVLDMDYSGSLTRKYDTSYNLNQPVPAPGNVADRRPIPGYAAINFVSSSANSSYNALQTRVDKRFSGGLTLTNAYTFQKILTVGSAGQDPRNRGGDKGPDVTDFRHRWALSVVYELPFGEGRRYLSNAPKVVNWILGGWEISGIESFQTGRPLTPSLNVDNANTGGGNRPDRIADGNLPKNQRSIDRYFDPNAFVRPAQQFTFGNAGRNFLYGPSHNNLDIALMKYFRFKEDRTLQFRFEMFNFPNHPNFTQPSTAFGTPDFGKIFQALQARQIQLGLRLRL